MRYIDIHAHWSAYEKDQYLIGATVLNAHSKLEMESLLQEKNSPSIIRSLGVHPQDPNNESLEFLLAVCSNKEERSKIHVIGEIGFDLHPDFRDTIVRQEQLFSQQLDLALMHHLPVIIHQRRAMSYVFQYTGSLRRVPAVIFHGYSGAWNEAIALRKRGVNAFFSIGTPVLWGAKIAERMAIELPLDWLFLETDAPYQPVRGKVKTTWADLQDIYQKVADLRQVSVEDLQIKLERNFIEIFGEEFFAKIAP
ncbi:TatD family hydrolase [Entomospira entomophila]|uniref:Hydrolase TatD n=1 Tax=Entomospira entomophila TaxID=2719988 RepID=A0A968G9L8_9SPIO|nr:TatD family hydrolase [Entomospira entomophilus]NIZ41133.1 hydrolase TatD [Entomospira entomophilus]WDI35340.1 TatD family hydrolase [Entomospira entomophilus]